MRAFYLVLQIVGVAALGFGSGCYDGEQLVREAKSTAVPTRQAEVDLGRFLTTLPRDGKSGSVTDLEVHLFAAVPRSRVAAVKRQVQAEDYRLRHELLAAVRAATSQELAEPNLARLRARMEEVVSSIFSDASIKSIGFYELTLRRR
jgi:hypothetical protein